MALSERLAIIITANGAAAVNEFKKVERSATRDLGKAETAGQKFKANWTRIAAGMVVVGAAIAQGLRAAINEADEAAVVGRQTEAVIKSTGGSANVTKSHLEDLAGALSKVAAVDDEVIQSAGNVMLTFKAVRNEVGEGNDIFDRAVASALDMSAALGGDLQSATLQLGKALANPLSGLTALRRAGVDFTQQQRDQIAAMVAVGDTLGAQKVIMDEVESQFDGAAEAGATGFKRIEVAWGNLLEKLGTPLVESGYIEWFAEGLEDPTERLKEYAREWSLFGSIFGDQFINTEHIAGAARVIGELPPALDDTASSAERAGSAIEDLTDAIDLYLSGTFDVPEAQRELGESFNQLEEQMTADEQNWRDQSAAMQDVVESTAAVISAMSEQGASQQAVDDQMRSSIQTLRAMRDAGMITGDQFVTLRDQILAIPHGTETKVTTPGARQSIDDVERLYAGLVVTGSAKVAPSVNVAVERAQFDRLVHDLDAADNRRFSMQVSVNYNSNKKRATGGPVAGGESYMVGEQGPEMFIPGESGVIVPADITADIVGGGASARRSGAAGGGTSIVVNVHGRATVDDGQAVVDALRRWQQRNGPVPVKVSA